MADASLNEINGVPLYQPNDPYHHDFDNKPIKALIERDNLILGVVNVLKNVLSSAGGNLGDLSLRLNQSIDSNGNLKPAAIDEAAHNIANHTDGRKQISQQELDYYVSLGYSVDNNPKFARYLDEERAKLSLISEEANKLQVSITPEGSPKHLVDNGEVNFQSSDTISVSIEDDNVIKFNSKFPVSVAHQHYYQVEPVTTNRVDYSINGISSFKQGSLRVYVNGHRIEQCSSDCADVDFSYYPSFTLNGSAVVVEWKKIYYEEKSSTADFSFSSVLGIKDKVFVDYDVVLI